MKWDHFGRREPLSDHVVRVKREAARLRSHPSPAHRVAPVSPPCLTGCLLVCFIGGEKNRTRSQNKYDNIYMGSPLGGKKLACTLATAG